MNTETTCCNTTATDTAVANPAEAPVFVATPEWSADKHDKGVDLEVSLPGVARENLDLQVSGSHLVLEARRTVSETRGTLIHGSEAPEAYRLKLRIGESLDGTSLSARLNDGVLRVSIPLVEAAQPKKIEIR